MTSSALTEIEADRFDSRRWLMLSILLTGIFLAPLDFFIINVALPSIEQDLKTTPSEIQLVISVFSISYAVFLITGGRLGDYYGRRRLFLLGLLAFVVSSAICGLAPSPNVLIFGRILQGFSASIMVPQGLASIHVIFPEKERPRALGFYGATYGMASVAGQILGGILISANILDFGWRAIFFINIPIGLGVLVAGYAFLKDSRSARPSTFDFVGTALLAATLATLTIPLIIGRENGWPIWAIISLIASPILAVLFWRYELRIEQYGKPLVIPSAFRSPALRYGLMAALLFYTVAVIFLLFSIYMQTALGRSAFYAGTIFSAFGVGFFIAPLVSPYLIQVFGKKLLLLGLFLEILGILAMSATVYISSVTAPLSLLVIVPVLFVIGFGLGLSMPSLLKAIIDNTDPSKAGLIAGVINSSLQISAALGIAVIGGVYYSALGNQHNPEAIGLAFSLSLLCVAICIFIAMLFVMAMNRASKNKT